MTILAFSSSSATAKPAPKDLQASAKAVGNSHGGASGHQCRGNGNEACAPATGVSDQAALSDQAAPRDQAAPNQAAAPEARSASVPAPEDQAIPTAVADPRLGYPAAGGWAGIAAGAGGVAASARLFTPLWLLIVAVVVFLVLQGRIDRRDPKLVASPLDTRRDFLRFR